MAQTRVPKTAEFDSIVIGGGLSGLLAAHQLEASGRRVALVEAMDSLMIFWVDHRVSDGEQVS